MRAVVFVNGEVRNYTALARWLRPGDHLIGADGGTRHILALDLMPDAVVGDLDSLEPATVTKLIAQGVDVERYPVAKDQTDLELAIERGLRAGADEILLLGALGGRLDQTLANLLILAQRQWPVPLRLVEGNELAQVLRSGETLALQAAPGSTVSAIPLSAAVTGITYTGLEYPLDDATLTIGSTRGVSNVVASAPATITIRDGVLLVVCVTEP
ncbi:MAG: thiamine diphosphokinase [Caldilineaceae bacterium]